MIDPAWLTYKTPPAIWKTLQDKFARENTTSFYYNYLSGLLSMRMEFKSKDTDHLTPWLTKRRQRSSSHHPQCTTTPIRRHPDNLKA